MGADRSRGLGIRFGLATVLSLAVVGGLVLWGGRLLPPLSNSELAPLTVLILLMTIVAVLTLVRLPLLFLWPIPRSQRPHFGRLPALENELRGFIEDYESDIESYRTELSALGEKAEPFLRELDNAQSDLAAARERLQQHRYPSAFRRYYKAQRELVDLTPGFELVDETYGRRRNRMAELVDQVRIDAGQLNDASVTAAVERHLAAFVTEQRADERPDSVPDLSQVKMAIRRIHAARLQSLSSYLQLRRFLDVMNAAMATGIIVMLVVGIGIILSDGVATTPLIDSARALGGSFIAEGRMLFIPMVLWFGALGAVLNILRRFGGLTLPHNTPTLQELPDDLIMRKSLISRVLWGSIAAFVVFLFTSLSGEFNVPFVILTALVSGFSEQLLEDVITKHHARLTRTADEDEDDIDDAAEVETTLTGVTYDSRGRLIVHGASKELVEDVLTRYEGSLDGLLDSSRQHGMRPDEDDVGDVVADEGARDDSTETPAEKSRPQGQANTESTGPSQDL